MAEFTCRICDENALEPVDAYAALPRVTSDCKPWPAGGSLMVCAHCGGVQKVADKKWYEEINQIYRAYQIYKLSGGSEQVIFDQSGAARPRSQALVDFIIREANLKAAGDLIDIGCGNGAALVNFSKALPSWSMHGTELSDAPLETLEALPNFGGFYKVEPKELTQHFDVVTMIHALEHMPDPGETLAESVRLLNDGGQVFVEIPNVETSPFDILIADHKTHFSPSHLDYLARRVGLDARIVRDDVLPKEITMLASRGAVQPRKPDAAVGRAIAHGHVNWLSALLRMSREIASKSRPFGIFGTSISGMWLYGGLDRKPHFFVDEDKTRIGGSYDGIPIVSPADVPAGSAVILPLNPGAANSVRERLKTIVRGELLVPPAA
jgi:2-polyprenyl-3-methyl-5-hydroxy-6-metoxy-1,4-benzoquinol methylase